MAEKSAGICAQCGRTVTRGAMTTHLRQCVAGAGALHVVVSGQDAPAYWLHIAVSRDAPLRAVDEFLRATWLECCGHLSVFQIDGTYYESFPEAGDEGMDITAEEAFGDGARQIGYQYDFGSTTRLKLSVAGVVDAGAAGPAAVALLAQNVAPEITCGVCQARPALEVCPYCGGFLCAGCRQGHACDAEWLLPVVNSPRTGVCAYTGPGGNLPPGQRPRPARD